MSNHDIPEELLASALTARADAQRPGDDLSARLLTGVRKDARARRARRRVVAAGAGVAGLALVVALVPGAPGAAGRVSPAHQTTAFTTAEDSTYYPPTREGDVRALPLGPAPSVPVPHPVSLPADQSPRATLAMPDGGRIPVGGDDTLVMTTTTDDRGTLVNVVERLPAAGQVTAAPGQETFSLSLVAVDAGSSAPRTLASGLATAGVVSPNRTQVAVQHKPLAKGAPVGRRLHCRAPGQPQHPRPLHVHLVRRGRVPPVRAEGLTRHPSSRCHTPRRGCVLVVPAPRPARAPGGDSGE